MPMEVQAGFTGLATAVWFLILSYWFTGHTLCGLACTFLLISFWWYWKGLDTEPGATVSVSYLSLSVRSLFPTPAIPSSSQEMGRSSQLCEHCVARGKINHTTHMHTRAHARTRAHTHMHIHTYIHTHTCTYTHTYTHHTHTHTYMHAHHIHAHTHTHTTHTHTHTHTLIDGLNFVFGRWRY